jgi:AcrR family transcriptional regulator
MQKIIHKTEELFMRYGIKSITMDEVARHCNMSKKTIYQHFPDKDSLVQAIMEKHMAEDIGKIDMLMQQNLSALEEVLKISEFMKKDIQEIHPSVLFDLKKYHSSAYELFEKHRDGHFIQVVSRNLEKGISEGVYRPGIDVRLYSRLRVMEVEAMFNRNLFHEPEWDLYKVQLSFIDHFVRGLVTPKGLNQWELISNNLFNEIR